MNFLVEHKYKILIIRVDTNQTPRVLSSEVRALPASRARRQSDEEMDTA